MSETRVFRAPWVLVGPDELVRDGALVVRAGRVVRLARGAAEVRRAVALSGGEGAGANVFDVDGVVVPGFVDAHAHLELTGVRSSPAEGFAGWVRGILSGRAAKEPGALEHDYRAGARALLDTGTTTVGDIDSTGACLGLESTSRPRLVRYVELLDGHDPERTAPELARWRAASRVARASDPLVTLGISPHAPFTVSPRLLGAIGRRLARHPRPVAVHWAETVEEVLFLAEGRGPFADVLGPSPRRSGLELLDEAGLLGPRTALIHGNLPEPGDWDTVAARGATLVHCPGSHRFFERPAFALDEARAAGVRIALGTDSRASNAALDMRREMRLAAEAHGGLTPLEVLRMATENGARALSLVGVAGTLAPGAWADFSVQNVTAIEADAILEEIVVGEPAIAGTWVAGELRGKAAAGARGSAAEVETRRAGGQE